MRTIHAGRSGSYRRFATVIASAALVLTALLAPASIAAGQTGGPHGTSTTVSRTAREHVRRHFPACAISGCTAADVTTSVTQAVNWLVTQQTAPDNASNPNKCWSTFGAFTVGESALAELQIIHSGLLPSSLTDRVAADKGAACLMTFVNGLGDIDNGSFSMYTTSLATWALQDYSPIAPGTGAGPSFASVTAAVANARSWLIANQANDTTGRADVPTRTTTPTFLPSHYANGGWYYYGGANAGWAEFSNSSFAVQALAATGGVPGAAPVPPAGSTADLAQGYFSCLQRMLAQANCGDLGILDNKDGGFIYSPAGDKGGTYTSNTGGSTFALMESGVSPTDARINAAIAWLDASMASNGGTNACQNNFHTGTSLASNWTVDTTLAHYALWANMKAHLLADVANGGTVPNPTLALSNYYGNLAYCIIGQQNNDGSFTQAPRETDLLATEFSVLTLEKVVPTTGVTVAKKVEQVGNKLFFTVSYTNGSNTVYGAFINDPVPSGTTFLSSGCSPACAPPNPTPIGGVITFGLGTLAPGASGVVSYSVTLGPNLLNGTRICNCATAFWNNSTGPPHTVGRITWTGGIVHVTFSALHTAPPVGSSITIKGVSPHEYNGTFVVKSSSTTSVSYALAAVSKSTGSGGVIVIPNGPLSSRGDCIDMIVDRSPVTRIQYTGDTVLATGNAATLSAIAVDSVTAAPIRGGKVTLALLAGGTSQSCTGVTDATGLATCHLDPVSAVPGAASMSVTVGAIKSHPSAHITTPVGVYQSLDTLDYTGATTFTNGNSGHPTAQLTDTGSGAAIVGAHVKFILNDDGVVPQTCTGTTNSAGDVGCTIATVSQPDGHTTLDVQYAGDSTNYPANAVTLTVTITGP